MAAPHLWVSPQSHPSFLPQPLPNSHFLWITLDLPHLLMPKLQMFLFLYPYGMHVTLCVCLSICVWPPILLSLSISSIISSSWSLSLLIEWSLIPSHTHQIPPLVLSPCSHRRCSTYSCTYFLPQSTNPSRHSRWNRCSLAPLETSSTAFMAHSCYIRKTKHW